MKNKVIISIIIVILIVILAVVIFSLINGKHEESSIDNLSNNQLSDSTFESNEDITSNEINEQISNDLDNTLENQNETINSNNNIGEEEKMPKLNIKIGNKNFSATLYDNETTREFINNMPLTINMNELNGNEKYYYMDNSLKTNSENVKKIKKGDLMLYGSNCLVLFYKSFSTSYSYTKLGYIDDANDLEQMVGKGNINITFELQK